MIDILTLIVSVAALIAAIYIPRQIMRNQMYTDLVREYRSPEMGAAVLALFNFYKDCGQSTEAVSKKYKDLYTKQIETSLAKGLPVDFSRTLHFQRRFVAQFYADMAFLHFERRLSKKQMAFWFTSNETKLLAILLHTAKPASEVFIKIDGIPEPPEDSVPMNELLYRLYEDVKAAG